MLPTVVAPLKGELVLDPVEFSASTAAEEILAATSAAGRPPGATSPYQLLASTCGMPSRPSSAYVGRARARLALPDGERPSLPAVTLPSSTGMSANIIVDVTAEQVVHGGRRAAIRHVLDVDARRHLGQFPAMCGTPPMPVARRN